MASKNFVFWETWVRTEVADMKIIFLPFLVQPGSTFWPQNAQI